MISYPRGLILDNANNYGIVKTETFFGFSPRNKDDDYFSERVNNTEPMEWILKEIPRYEDSFEEESTISARSLTTKTKKTKPKMATSKVADIKHAEEKSKKKRESKGAKKCIFKILKSKGGNKRKGKFKMSKIMMPMILGLLAAKSVLIPIALKALAFISAKGLMMGLFSTMLSSLLSLKGMWDHSHGHYQHRKDDQKTQVEIIHIPTKPEDHHVYYDEKSDDFIPIYNVNQL